jgi:hypothetical protein
VSIKCVATRDWDSTFVRKVEQQPSSDTALCSEDLNPQQPLSENLTHRTEPYVAAVGVADSRPSETDVRTLRA